MRIVPVTLKEAKQFIAKHHRHNKPPVGWLFGTGILIDGELRGVGVAGRPVARELDDGESVEITRVCTVGDKNANSCLYGAILRASKALGYNRAFTYTLQSESGASIKAVGFTVDAKLQPRATWDCPARRRFQNDLFGNETRPAESKVRWIKIL